jgi:hypothetical protein
MKAQEMILEGLSKMKSIFEGSDKNVPVLMPKEISQFMIKKMASLGFKNSEYDAEYSHYDPKGSPEFAIAVVGRIDGRTITQLMGKGLVKKLHDYFKKTFYDNGKVRGIGAGVDKVYDSKPDSEGLLLYRVTLEGNFRYDDEGKVII